MKENVDTTQSLIKVLDEYFESRLTQARTISPYYENLWAEITRLVHAGGKKLRPKMTLMAYQAFGGQDVEKVLPIAAAQELLHVGLLIHDDVIDRDTIRYGVNNIEGEYGSIYESLVGDEDERGHYAKSAAILAGDVLISGAYQLILESNAEPEHIVQVQRILATGIFEVIGGELIDTESVFREAGSIPSETVARYKTASYSFITPLLIGAILAGASEQDQQRIREFAESVGLALQLRDDLIGLFGDESVTGKSTVGDIREGKRTYLVEQFEQLSNSEQKAQFAQYYGRHAITNEDAETVRELIINSGAKQKAEDAILTLEDKAHAALHGLSIDQQQVSQFHNLIALATRRDK